MEVTKFTLSSGKIIYLREPLIDDTEKAAQVAGKQASSENMAHLGLLVQKELLKLLLVQVNDKKLTLNEKQDLNGLFKYKEYQECMRAVKMVIGEEGNEPLTPEFATIGG